MHSSNLTVGVWLIFCFGFFWGHGFYSILGEVSLVSGRFCSHLVEAKQVDYICLLVKIFLMSLFFSPSVACFQQCRYSDDGGLDCEWLLCVRDAGGVFRAPCD